MTACNLKHNSINANKLFPDVDINAVLFRSQENLGNLVSSENDLRDTVSIVLEDVTTKYRIVFTLIWLRDFPF